MQFSLVSVLALVAAAVATGTNQQCASGNLYCCNSSMFANNPAGGAVAVPLNIFGSLQCSKIAGGIGGILGSSWYAVPPW